MGQPAPDANDKPTTNVPVRDLTHHTSRVLARVKEGEVLTITERGEPIATVIPLPRGGPVRPATGYVASSDPDWAQRAADELTGFGE